MKLTKYLFLILALVALGCSEDENVDAVTEVEYQASSVTCDDVDQTPTTVLHTITFAANAAVRVSLAGFTLDASSVCAGIYPVSSTNFADDDTFTYTRPSAATTCSNADAEQVDSCDVSGISCDTSSQDPAITVAGTYTKDAEEVVLTYTSDGNSFCNDGEVEVITLTAQ